MADDIKKDRNATKNLKYEHDKDREIVKGVFKFHECPGQELSFWFRVYKQDDLEKYVLEDGKVYELPLGVAKHLNTSGKIPRYEYIENEYGFKSMKVKGYHNRYSFQSLEFADIKELSDESKPVIHTIESLKTF